MGEFEYGSEFFECVVKPRLTFSECVKRFMIILGGTVIFAVLLMLNLGILGIIAGGWFIVFFVNERRVEYEYSLKGNVLDIYRITAKSRRRKMIPLELQRLEKFGTVGDKEYNHQLNIKTKVLDFTSKNKKNEIFYAVVNRPKGKFMVLIEPDRRISEQMQIYIPKIL